MADTSSDRPRWLGRARPIRAGLADPDRPPAMPQPIRAPLAEIRLVRPLPAAPAMNLLREWVARTAPVAPESVTLVLVAAAARADEQLGSGQVVRCRWFEGKHAHATRARSASPLLDKNAWSSYKICRPGLTLAEAVGYDLVIMRRFVLILSSRSGT
ncbi:MAG: hypothetical protein WBH47_07305 [Streptosporangiaceae bacterium]